MTIRALTFGTDAAGYERHRPGYPDSLIAMIIGYAALPIRTALEVGAGTGKATRAVAAHKITVIASEPDPRMLDVLREQTAGLPVRTMVGTFEQLPLDELAGQVQLVYAAAAWHWTDPATRWDRLAAILPAGGTAAFFGGELELADPEVRARFQQAIGGDADPHAGPQLNPVNRVGWAWPANEIAEDDRFEAIEEHTIPRRLQFSRDDFIGHIGTQSRFLVIEPEQRKSIFERVRSAMPDTIEFVSDLVLHLARRV
jgi:SAM-dependent methyltransferase